MQVSDSKRVFQPPQPTGLSDLSLGELAETVAGLTQVPTLAQVIDWFSSLLVRPRDYERYRFFSEPKYARNLIIRGEYAELLLLCWRQGQRTPIHDHGGSIGVVTVFEGMMTETMFERAPEGHVRPHNTYRRGPGIITGADVPDIHQLLNLEQDGRDLVTLHCYAPPLSVLNTYSQHSSRVKHWRELYFSGGAGI